MYPVRQRLRKVFIRFLDSTVRARFEFVPVFLLFSCMKISFLLRMPNMHEQIFACNSSKCIANFRPRLS